MTFAPQPLLDLATYWSYHHGVFLGIVGDTAHMQKGVSYHLGQDDLQPGAYSTILPRDREPYLTNAASAIDLGKLNGGFPGLRDFSVAFVAAIRADPVKYRDVREVIYSPDGKVVRRWDNELKALRVGGDGTGQGDNSHLYHTHISFYRDSEKRDKRPLFSPYFDPALPDSSTAPTGDSMTRFANANGLDLSSARLVSLPAGTPITYLDGSPYGNGKLGAAITVPHLGIADAQAGHRLVVLEASGPYADGIARSTVLIAVGGTESVAPVPAPPVADCAAQIAAEHERVRTAAIAAAEAL